VKQKGIPFHRSGPEEHAQWNRLFFDAETAPDCWLSLQFPVAAENDDNAAPQ
jgi:hypothetical protein